MFICIAYCRRAYALVLTAAVYIESRHSLQSVKTAMYGTTTFKTHDADMFCEYTSFACYECRPQQQIDSQFLLESIEYFADYFKILCGRTCIYNDKRKYYL